MPQNPGLFNTAPSPIPGGGTNPAGMNIGLPGVSNQGFPPAHGGIPLSPTTANNAIPTSLFPANGQVDPIGNLNSGFGTRDQFNNNLFKEFRRAYGKGTGDMLFQIFSKGLFNPQVANALIAAMQPARARGLNDIQNMFGDAGARFSSAAAIGAGDFESQFALGENQVLAQLFQHAQDQQLGLLEHTLPTLHTEEANQGGGFLSKLLPILETAAGIGLEFVPGAQGLGTALIGSGIGGLTGKGGKDGGGSNSSGDIASAIEQMIKPSSSNLNFSGFPGAVPGGDIFQDPIFQDIIFGKSGASALTNSSDPFGE